MSNKNEVFEYLIDQLRQQLPVVDVMGEIKRWSIDRSIAGRGNYTDEENAVIDAYIGLEHNTYKKQCEDLAHEVLSLKNQLRDASAQINELHLALAQATGDVEMYKLVRKGGYGSEQSGCRDDAAQVEKSWVEHDGAAACPVPDDTVVDIKFRNGEVESNTKALWWSWRTNGGPYEIVAYRVVEQGHGTEQSGCRKGDTQGCEHDWVLDEKGDYFVCAKCGKQEAELIDCPHTNTVGLRKGFAPGFTKKCLDCGAKLK